MDKFLNLFSKYPWVAIVIVTQWIATSLVLVYAQDINATQVMGLTFLSTVIFAYFGFKVPKG